MSRACPCVLRSGNAAGSLTKLSDETTELSSSKAHNPGCETLAAQQPQQLGLSALMDNTHIGQIIDTGLFT